MMNELAEWMKFANEHEMFGHGYSDSAGSYNPNARRAEWAVGQMEKQRNGGAGGPNFFGQGQGLERGGMPGRQGTSAIPPQQLANIPQYIQPQQFQGMRDPNPMQDGMRPQVQNYLAQLLGR